MSNRPSFTLPSRWFDRWNDPERFFEDVRDIQRPIGNVSLFTDPALQPLFDAWIAGQFAAIRNTHESCRVRLIRPGGFPDFEILVDHRIEAFEATEADRPGRRRGDEYREDEMQVVRGEQAVRDLGGHDELRQWAIHAIRDAAQRKAAKRYGSKVNLLIFVNVPTFVEEPLDLDKLAELTAIGQTEFLAIWLLWSNKSIRTWPSPLRIVSPFP
jgi:hypothetical protein